MYIKEFLIENFRSIEKLKLKFNKGVNIIIGENNSGKTAIIDALRICLSYGSLSRDVYIKKDEDFFINSNIPNHESNEIKFDLIFQPENQLERSIFTDFITQEPNDSNAQTIELHFRYFLEIRGDKSILRWRVWGGENEGQQVPIEALQLINSTYLGALRNATEKLKPHSYGNKIATLYRNLKNYSDENDIQITLTKEQKSTLAQELKDQVDNGNWNKVVQTGNKKVLEHITHSTINGKEPNVEFSFLPYTYEGIVDNIEARKPVYIPNGEPILEQKYFKVSQNGLGENNIIYAGTVLGDLIDSSTGNVRDSYYNALLIEEPEAHLHPQKQNTFFQYLSSLNNLEVQIFITSHSPTITAKANLDYITVLQRDSNKISSFSINNSELDQNNKKYLSKFLDVTKSQLFFANGVILVEGISEALLLQVFSEIINEDLEKNGIEIVNLNGVAFKHFARLFNSDVEERRLLARCTLLTDDDKGQITNKAFNNELIDEDSSKAVFKILKENNVIDKLNRIHTEDLTDINFPDNISAESIQTKLRELIDKPSDRAVIAEGFTGGVLKTKFAEITFEYELMKASSFNIRLIRSIYRTMHPRIKYISSQEPIEKQSYHILKKLYSNKDKSELAHRLAVTLDECEHLRKRFVIPNYIQEGIKWVTKGIE